MSLSLLITINFLAGVALLATLAYAISRATRLTPHVAARDATPAVAGIVPPLMAQRHARVRSHERARVRAPAPIATHP
jgi:hypothetical protein